MLEKNIQQKILKLCKEKGILAVKVDSTSSRGWPDLTLILPCGTALFIELKTEKGVLSELQKHMIEKIRRNNGNVYVLRSVEQFRELLREYKIIT